MQNNFEFKIYETEHGTRIMFEAEYCDMALINRELRWPKLYFSSLTIIVIVRKLYKSEKILGVISQIFFYPPCRLRINLLYDHVNIL